MGLMATIEAELSNYQSRRDFISFSSKRRGAGGYPPRRPDIGRPSISPEPPDKGGFRLGRRSLIIAGAVAVVGTIAVATALLKPWELFQTTEQEQFVDPALKELGHELYNWQQDGTKLSAIFPEINKAADILTGKIDPRTFIPIMKLPLMFKIVDNNPDFNLKLVEDTIDPRGILVSIREGTSTSLPWISRQSEAAIRLTPTIRANTVRRPITVKEVSQLYDHYEYCRLYLSLVQNAGVKVDINNLDNMPISETEKIIVMAHQLRRHEEITFQKRSFLIDIVDFGSAIKIGGILFANWYVDQLNRKLPIQENADWFKTGHDFAGFLQSKGLIIQRQRGGLFTWTKGQSPNINSEEFLKLVEEYSGRTRAVFV